MKEFEKNYRAYYQVCRDGEQRSKKGKEILHKLYDAVPESVNFGDFMDAFLERPTYNLEESVSWMMNKMKELSAA